MRLEELDHNNSVAQRDRHSSSDEWRTDTIAELMASFVLRGEGGKNRQQAKDQKRDLNRASKENARQEIARKRKLGRRALHRGSRAESEGSVQSRRTVKASLSTRLPEACTKPSGEISRHAPANTLKTPAACDIDRLRKLIRNVRVEIATQRNSQDRWRQQVWAELARNRKNELMDKAKYIGRTAAANRPKLDFLRAISGGGKKVQYRQVTHRDRDGRLVIKNTANYSIFSKGYSKVFRGSELGLVASARGLVNGLRPLTITSVLNAGADLRRSQRKKKQRAKENWRLHNKYMKSALAGKVLNGGKVIKDKSSLGRLIGGGMRAGVGTSNKGFSSASAISSGRTGAKNARATSATKTSFQSMLRTRLTSLKSTKEKEE